MTDFATDLSIRICSHDEFWEDYRFVRSRGARASLSQTNGAGTPLPATPDITLQRLIFSASIFAQSSRESDHALAQSIALSSLFASNKAELFQSATSLLAQLGNFPGVRYLQENLQTMLPAPISEMQLHLLKSLNTVDVSGVEMALTDFQFNIWASIPSIHTASISAPTSAGKSFVVIEYLCKQAIERSSFVGVYVAPTRALLSEVSKKISFRLDDAHQVRVSTVPSMDPESSQKQIYVLTQERLSSLLGISDLRPDILIVDEAQNIGDGSRGMILQDCIERIRDRNPNAQVLLLSPSTTGFPAAMKTLGIQDTAIKETLLSPVLQNRILVHAVAGEAHVLRLSLLEKGVQTPLGSISTERGVDSAEMRLATVALELGSGGGALVYATGAADAEKVAARLMLGSPRDATHALSELADFIRTHIHKDYGLAESVQHGVAFHYGKMPSLLREALENGFEQGHIKFLVCTTTLFQGINLPARNVFINTPTRGQGNKLDPALLWNFAGRAGRLSKDVVGNVFLVDYDSWQDKPLDQMVRLEVYPALARTLSERHAEVIDALSGAMPKDRRNDETPQQVRAAAGYLLARTSRGSISKALERYSDLDLAVRAEIVDTAERAWKSIGLPPNILESSWTVDPFGLARLRDRLAEKLAQDLLDDFIPCDPTESRAYGVYAGIFNLIAREVWQWDATKLGGFVANYATQWMRGTPYPVLIGKWVKYKTKKKPVENVDRYIRSAFEFIEDELRFKWVQHARAYVDVLDYVLLANMRDDLRTSVYDFSLALELGVSTRSARSFIEIGLSRIAAATLASLVPDSQLSVDGARSLLKAANVRALPLSPVILRELEDLQLVI